MGNNNRRVLSNAEIIEGQSYLTVDDIIELLNELDDEFRPNSALLVRYAIEQDVPLSDILWFAEWDPAMLRFIEFNLSDYRGFLRIFNDWDAYIQELEDGLDDYGDDPMYPYNGYVSCDAGLSGVWYVLMRQC